MNNNNNFKTDQYEKYNKAIKESEQPQIILCSNAQAIHAKKRSYNRSKRNMPTTLLNANPSNFRDIVQKFTGRSASIDISVRRKGPVTLDFRSPASVSEEVIFPSSGDIKNHECAIDTHVSDGEGHVTCEWEGKKTASYGMGQLSDDCELYGGCDHNNGHDNYEYHNDDHDIIREYLENSSFDGVINMDFDEFYPDAVMVEEFLMRDLDI